MSLIATLDQWCQHIRITPEVTGYLASHRQISKSSLEAGGQLFGSIDASAVVIMKATGPYQGDQRSRYSHRSNPIRAQAAIETYSRERLLYLGEWHTHPQQQPIASIADRDAMQRLEQASQIRVNQLLMLIQGRAEGVSGLALYSSSGGHLIQWTLRTATEDEYARAPQA